MGYFRHHALVVTSSFARIEEAHAFAAQTGASVTPLSAPQINGYRSFAVLPDGSKEGWADSGKGDDRRDRIVEYLSRSALDWVEIVFGGDDPEEARITRGSGLQSGEDT